MRFAVHCLLTGLLTLNVGWAANLGGAAPAGSDLAQAQKQIAQKEWPAAVATLEKYTKANPTDAEGFNLLASVCAMPNATPKPFKITKKLCDSTPSTVGPTSTWAKPMCSSRSWTKPRPCWPIWKRFVASSANSIWT